MRGALIAFEGLDQSGKQTQAERLRDVLLAEGRQVRFLSFPEYSTAIGTGSFSRASILCDGTLKTASLPPGTFTVLLPSSSTSPCHSCSPNCTTIFAD